MMPPDPPPAAQPAVAAADDDGAQPDDGPQGSTRLSDGMTAQARDVDPYAPASGDNSQPGGGDPQPGDSSASNAVRRGGGRPARRVSWQGSLPSSRGSTGSLRESEREHSGALADLKVKMMRRKSSDRSFSKMMRRSSNDGSAYSGGSDGGRGSFNSRRDSVTSAHSKQSRRASSISGVFSWTRMAKKDDIWEDFEGSDYYEVSYREEASLCLSEGCKSAKRTVLKAVRTPSIIIITLLVLAILLTVGLLTIHKLADAYEAQLQSEAVDTAEELGMWISRQLDEALLPLFTMSQFVQHLDTFKGLPYQIGPRGEVGSAPPLVGRNESHRNVTGICDDPDVLSVFDDIASSVKRDAGMEGILVNVQLAPQAVVCLLHPLVNTEDFADGIVMDNTKAVGHDLLNDPKRVAIARATIPASGVVIAGPLTLVQGDTPVVQEAFIARLAINIPGYSITLDGVDYDCWGFAVILLNWAALREKSGIDAAFKREGLEYRLTRTDRVKDTATGLFNDKVATIARSEKSDALDESNSISVDLDTTNNLWVMDVGYAEGFTAPWLKGLTALVVILSVGISILLMTVLVAKREMKDLLYNMMPPKIVKKLRRGETVVQRYDLATIFFSDIVGFTTLSGTMSPIDVMDMLNEMYTHFDKLVVKHNAYKVETIGDAYIVIGGGPDECLGREGAEKVALFALDAMKFCEDFEAKNGAHVRIRAGLASGPVVAGVVGQTMPKFTLFGDTVNLASRMESTSVKMRIQCSDMTYRLLMDAQGSLFDLEQRRSGDEVGVHVKGKGHTMTWWINGASPRASDHSLAPYEQKALHLDFGNKDGEESDVYHNEDTSPNTRRSITFQDEVAQSESNDDIESVDSDGQLKDKEEAPRN